MEYCHYIDCLADMDIVYYKSGAPVGTSYATRRRLTIKVRHMLKVAVILVQCVCLAMCSRQVGGSTSLCSPQCRCMDKGSVITCVGSGLAYIPDLLSTTLVLDLDNNHISYLKNGSLLAVPRLEILSMQDNGIMYMDSGIFANLIELRILRLGKNQLTFLPADIFQNNHHLEVLDLHQNRFRGPIPDSMAVHLHSLQIFNISYNDLDSPYLGQGFRFTTEIQEVDLSGNNFLSLESQVFAVSQAWDSAHPHALYLSYCNIRHIHPHAFTSLTKIETLSLEGNNNIPSTELETALLDLQVSNLQVINLSHMNISDMYNLFRSFKHKNLLQLDMSRNRITVINQRTFFYLVNLRRLDLSHNIISDIRDLTGLSRLQRFNLAHNAIRELDSTILEGLQELQEFDLSHNLLTSIDSMPFMNMFSLRTLDISANLLSQVLITSGLESLAELRLNDNRITSVDFLKGLPHIEKLDLSSNSITQLGANIFTRGQHFKYTNFSGNSIYSFHPKAFRGSDHDVLDLSFNRLTTLTNIVWGDIIDLHLEHNHLSNLSSLTFANLHSLERLHLQGNNLYTFPEGSFTDLDNLIYLDLSNNPLGHLLGISSGAALINQLRRLQELHMSNVDLRILPVFVFVNLTMLTVLNLSGNSIQDLGSDCAVPGLSKLQSLDISDNLLQSPNPRCFSGRRLQRVDFSGNPLACTCDLMPLHNWILSSHNVTVLQLREDGSYLCQSPLEWRGVPLVDFHLDDASCSYHEKAIIFTAIGCTLVALILLVTVAIFRYKWWYRRKLAQTRYSFIDDNLNGGLGSMSMNGSAVSTECSSTVVTNHRTSRDWV